MTDPVTQEYRQAEKNREWLKNNDLASGSGGGGGTVVSDAINGLVKDYSPTGGIDGLSVLLLDPRAQVWQAEHEYSNGGNGGGHSFVGAYVVPSVNPNGVKFFAFENGSFVSGDSEPDWGGGSPASDGTLARQAVWATGSGVYQVWAPGASLTGTIFESGSAWGSDSGGMSAGVKPDFSATDVGATVSDNAITWTNLGPAYGEWEPGTRYGFRANADRQAYGQPYVVPIGATPDVDEVWQAQPSSFYGTTDDTEPVGWDAATPGDNSVWFDGDIMWVENTSDEQLVLTGIVAPSSATVVQLINVASPEGNTSIVLEDQAEAESEYGSESVSTGGNGFNFQDSNLTVVPGQGVVLVYANDQWQAAFPATL